MAKEVDPAEEVVQEFTLSDPPRDGISCMKFSPESDGNLLVTSWDGAIRLYNVHSNRIMCFSISAVPLLTGCFSEANKLFSGGLDGLVKSYDAPSMSVFTLGCHGKGVRCLLPCEEITSIVSGSWDGTCKIWDERAQLPPATIKQGDKVYGMTMYENKLIVATAARKILTWDVRYPSTPLHKKDAGTKYQIRTIEHFPNGDGHAMGTIEGRIYIEVNDEKETSPLDKYSFKCHRSLDKNNVESIYPVNDISFHKSHMTFASGGSDGYVNIWDGYNKKRLCQLKKFPTSISALSFSGNGLFLAVATSYQFEDKNTE